jgi:hypothetical protein
MNLHRNFLTIFLDIALNLGQIIKVIKLSPTEFICASIMFILEKRMEVISHHWEIFLKSNEQLIVFIHLISVTSLGTSFLCASLLALLSTSERVSKFSTHEV